MFVMFFKKSHRPSFLDQKFSAAPLMIPPWVPQKFRLLSNEVSHHLIGGGVEMHPFYFYPGGKSVIMRTLGLSKNPCWQLIDMYSVILESWLDIYRPFYKKKKYFSRVIWVLFLWGWRDWLGGSFTGWLIALLSKAHSLMERDHLHLWYHRHSIFLKL